MTSRFIELGSSLAPDRRRLTAHSVYSRLATLEDVRILMESHVFAVWDFMSLLKALQRNLTGVELPWVPCGDPALRRFINEIVLGEECDEDGEGGYSSHFELYLVAMRDAGADTGPVVEFVRRVTDGCPVDEAMVAADAPVEARAFVSDTLDIIGSGAAHRIAAAFTLGREEIIPDMFMAVVSKLAGTSPTRLARLHAYLQRHIELDGYEHGPLAQRMLETLCGDDIVRWQQAESTGRRVLRSRIALWDGVLKRVDEQRLASESAVN